MLSTEARCLGSRTLEIAESNAVDVIATILTEVMEV